MGRTRLARLNAITMARTAAELAKLATAHSCMVVKLQSFSMCPSSGAFLDKRSGFHVVGLVVGAFKMNLWKLRR